MTTIPTNGGFYTFQNYGPLTTTYTPAPSCTATDRIILGTLNEDNFPYQMYKVNCATAEYSDCMPSPTPTPTTSPNYDDWIGFGTYYSPGLYCPSGWVTVAQAARDGDKPYTTSGAMSIATVERIPYFPYIPTMLASALQPSETVALCCPRYIISPSLLGFIHLLTPFSGYTADILGGCWDTVPSYKITQVCELYDHTSYAYSTSTKIYTTDGTKTTEKHIVSTPTFSTTSTHVESLPAGEEYSGFLTPYSYVSAVTLIHRESDVQATGTGASSVTATADATTTGSAGSTSNSAQRLRPGSSSWEFGVVLGISAAAVAMGAAIIFPFY